MKLTRIDIRSLPGVRPGFSIEAFEPGANFITGPNAIGKSSVIRALRYLLREPGPDDPRGLSLSAEFRDGDTVWSVHREGSARPEWERNGRPGNAPPLPAADAISSYLVTVEDLMRVQGGDEQGLADTLRRELHGGFDLRALREAFPLQPRVGQSEGRDLEKARRQLRAIEREQAELHRQQERLPALDEEIGQAAAGGREAERLQAAVELLEALREHANLERESERFPDGMARLAGNELERLKELEARLDGLRQSKHDQQRQLDEARRTLDDTGLENNRPADEALELTRDRLTALERLEQRIAEQHDAVVQARSRRDSARQRLGSQAEHADTLPRIDEDGLARARDLARRIDQAERRRNEYRGLLEAQPADAARSQNANTHDDDADAESLQRGAGLLRDWLATPASPGGGNRIAAGVLAGIGAAAALAAGLGAPGWLGIVGAAFVLLALVLPRLAQPGAGPAEAIRENYRALALPQPADWTRPEVLALLQQLDAQLAAQRVEEERRQRADEYRRQFERAGRELADLEAERRALAKELGFDPALVGQRDDFLARVHAWQNAVADLDAAEAQGAELERRAADVRERIAGFLRQYPGTPDDLPQRHGELAAAFGELRKRSRLADEAARAHEQAEQAVSRLDREIGDEAQRSAEIYRDAGLEDGHRRTLAERLELLDDWKALNEKINGARRIVEDRQSRLAEHPELVELAEGGARDEIERRLAAASGKHERLDALREERTRIEERIHAAEARHDRESALAEVRALESALDRRREEVLEAETAHFLLDEIEDEYRSEQQPPLLEAAQQQFARFTHEQWTLDLDDSEHGTFRARDTIQGVWRRPAELSTATRMQLLLALRLAHVQTGEFDAGGHQTRCSLPLLIDEALTTSDHERAGVILRNFAQLAADGRQIIYLAAGEHEFRLWQHATGETPNRIDLAEIRNRPGDGAPPDFEPPAPPRVADPDGHSPRAYAELLEVPAVDPRAEAGGVHLFHLMHDELAALHHLLQDWRISTLGQLEALLQGRAARHAIADEGTREKLIHRCRLTRDWIAAWRIGRGRPVDRGVLEQADGITDTTIDRVSEKAKETDHDAQALIRALEAGEVKGFRDEQRKRLAEYLLTHGYLPDREPLTPDERRQRLLHHLDGRMSVTAAQAQIDWLEAALSAQARD